MDQLLVSLSGTQHKLCYYVVVVVVVVVADGSDYTDNGVTIVTLSGSQSQVAISFPLIDDDVFEITEYLSATLSFEATELPRVSISPNFTEISIFDNDSKLDSYTLLCLALLGHCNAIWAWGEHERLQSHM